MPELRALISRHLRATVRGRAARAGAVLFVLGLITALVLPADAARGAGLAALGSLFVLALFVSGFAIGAGGALPEDRISGREGWLAALAPAGWQRRLAIVLSAWGLAVVMGGAGGLLIGTLMGVARPDATFQAHTPVALPEGAVLAASSTPVPIPLDGRDADVELEIDVRPLYSRALNAAPADIVEVTWSSGADGGSLLASARGPLRLTVPAGASSVRLGLNTERVRLRLTGARRLDGTRSPLLALTWAGLLLGLLAGAVAPLAVLFSRATTGQTAAAAAFCLLLFGATRQGLTTLAGDLNADGLMSLAPGLLRAVAWIAPDAPLLHIVSEAGALRAPGVASAGLVVPAIAYAVVTTFLACAPVPRRFAEGRNA